MTNQSNPLKLISKFGKEAGIFALLVAICSVTALLEWESFTSASNLQNTIRWTALFGVISIGVSFVIMTGGIDLSIGSVICLVGAVLSICLRATYTPEDPIPIVSANLATNTLQLADSATDYAAGDLIRVKKTTYRVEAVDADKLTIDKAPTERDLDFIKDHSVKSVSAVDETVVQHDGQDFHTRTIIVDDEDETFVAGDSVKLKLDKTSKPVELIIHKASTEDAKDDKKQTVLQVLVPPGHTFANKPLVATPDPTWHPMSTALVRAHAIQSMSNVSQDVILRGTERMHSVTVTINGEHPNFRPEDQLHPLGQQGGQSYVIHSTTIENGKTAIRILVREKTFTSAATVIMVESRSQRMPIPIAIVIVLAISLVIGLTHGLLITRVKLQPFVVTLCGLLFYRGLIRGITEDQTEGFGQEYPTFKAMVNGGFMEQVTGYEYVFDFPMTCIYLLVLAVIAAIFLNKTIHGRYILAVGRNQEAALYSGINTNRVTVMAYVICSICAGIAGILFGIDLGSVQPATTGSFYELYAIAGAVLGGCSLRGGEGSVVGVIIATAVMQVLRNAINLVSGKFPLVNTSTEFAIIGLVILAGVVTDELVKRASAKRRAAAARES